MTATLQNAFVEQAGHCEAMDSPFMGRLLRGLAESWPDDTELSAKLAQWSGDIGPMGASLPLRVAGGLHALHLQGQEAALSAVYPPNTATDAQLLNAARAALVTHDTFLCDWVDQAPQTNEVRRSVALIAATRLLSSRFDLPIRLSELGASGGLNLMFDKFALAVDDQVIGPSSPALTLSPEWSGPVPAGRSLDVAERAGVDLNPIDAHHPDGVLRLIAYLWPDQTDRLTRTRAAIAAQDAVIDKDDAIDWLEPRLVHRAGQMHLIYHTIAWQYFPAEAQTRGTRLIEAAGERADMSTPLAWLRMEADGENPGARLDLRLWPGNIHITLGRIDFHGRWVNWTGPVSLP